MYLLDTHIVSELRKGSGANAGVRGFFAARADEALYLAVQTVGEIRRGIENVRGRGDEAQARLLENWLDQVVAEYSDRILGFDLDCAQVWGKLMSPVPHHPVDKQIAAIALIHDLAVVTRNVEDFRPAGVRTINPFT